MRAEHLQRAAAAARHPARAARHSALEQDACSPALATRGRPAWQAGTASCGWPQRRARAKRARPMASPPPRDHHPRARCSGAAALLQSTPACVGMLQRLQRLRACPWMSATRRGGRSGQERPGRGLVFTYACGYVRCVCVCKCPARSVQARHDHSAQNIEFVALLTDTDR